MSRRRRAKWEQQAKIAPPQPPQNVENFFPNTDNTSGIGYLVTWAGLKRATAKKKPLDAGSSQKPTDPELSKSDDPNDNYNAGLFR